MRHAVSVIVFALLVVPVTQVGPAHATTTRFPAPVYGYDRADSNGQGARTSVPAPSRRAASPTPNGPTRWTTTGFAGFLAAEDAGGLIYRTGPRTDNALTDASGVSFRDSISSSADRVQVFRRGDKIWAVDTSKLPPGSVVRDGGPAGHVTVRATPAQIREAVVDDPALRDLGLKRLDDGSYRLPK
jgi:hypothetical protein